MTTPRTQSPSVTELAREENATPEQIVASAVTLYAALPPVVRASLLDALRSGAAGDLANELTRTAVIHEMRQRREAMAVGSGFVEVGANNEVRVLVDQLEPVEPIRSEREEVGQLPHPRELRVPEDLHRHVYGEDS